MTDRHVRIAAVGKHLPTQVLTNEELVERFDLDVDAAWIESRTGIRSRHWMRDDETTSDMVVAAANAVLANAGVAAADVDRLILATISPDQPSPATAVIVARRLGARCAAFDVSAACAGFLYGLDLGRAAILAGEERVLVLAADARSRYVDPTDRRSVVLFADGCAGVLLESADEPGFLSIAIGAEGRERPGAEVPAGGAREPASHATVDARRHYVQVDGKREIFDLFVRFTREACDRALERAGLTLADVDLFITHQGNAFMVQEVLDALEIPPERAVNDVVHHGNTSSATVPIALTEAFDAGRITPGSIVLLTSVGAGYTFGAAGTPVLIVVGASDTTKDTLLRGLLRDAARRVPDANAVVDEVRTVSFAQLDELASRCAARLESFGVRPDDRVAIVSKNRFEFVVLYFALFELGAVAVPLNWRLRASELAELIADAGARVVFGEPAFRLPADLFDGRWSAMDDLAGDERRASRSAEDESGVAVQMYTSGTTGRAKGSMLSHANVDAMQRAWREDMPLAEARSRFLQVTPLFHVGALLMMVSCVASGATLRLLPEFTADRAAAVLADEGITHALFVPAMLQWLLAEPAVRSGAAKDLELVVYGAAPMPVPLLRDALDVLGCGFLQGYGLTETAGVLTTLTPDAHRFAPHEPAPARLASAGKAVSCCEVRVVDEQGMDVPVGESGEVVARGTNVHVGYWKRDESDVDRDGWFHTGDLGCFDEHDYLYLVDRVKDMICVAGENVYPREIERRLLEHEAVRDAAVIGVPNEHWGEEVLALVVRDGAAEVSNTELIQHCRATLARFKCPTRVEWIDEVPRNAAGKITKAVLREPHWRGRERKV